MQEGVELLRMMQILDRILDRIVLYAMYIASVITLIMAFTTTYGVLRRYAFNDPEHYSYEIGIFCLISSVCLSLAYIQRKDRNLKVDLISNHYPPKFQGIFFNILVPTIALTYLVTLVWRSLDDAVHSFQIGERTYSAWGPPVFPIKILVPIGAALRCVVLISQLVRGFYALRNSSRVPLALKKDGP